MVDARIGANETVACVGDQHVIAADDAPRLFQDYFHERSVLLLPLRDGLRLERRPDCRQPDYSAFGLGNNFLRDDEDVSVFESDACFACSVCYLSREIVAELNLRQSGQTKQAYTRTDSGRVRRRRAGTGAFGHNHGIEILRDPRRRFTYEKHRRKKNGRLRLRKRPSETVLDYWRCSASVGRLVAFRFVLFLLRLVFRLVGRLVFRAFLLLFLLKLLLLLVVFALELLELLLLFLLDLLFSRIFGVLLLNLLLLLNLFLLDLLALLILLQAELFQFLLMFLVNSRIHVVRPAGVSRTRRRRAIVANPRIARGTTRVAGGIAGVSRSVATVARSVSGIGWRVRGAVGRIRRGRVVHRGRAIGIVLHVALVVLRVALVILPVP